MHDATLSHFRAIADLMAGSESQDWQWVGPHLSQRMFGITERRAREYAERHGGEARQMPPAGWFTSAAYELSRSGSETRAEAEGKREQMPHPSHWYVWQMNDGRWHISLLTKFRDQP